MIASRGFGAQFNLRGNAAPRSGIRMPLSDANIAQREDDRLAWTRRVLARPDAGLERASVDAGFRSYWRSTGVNPSRIVMDSPPDKEDVRPWLAIRALLESGGVRVPRVLAEDIASGFLLLEDLGAQTYLHIIDADNADARFEDAVTQLLRLQGIAPPADLPAYDEALLARELRLFDEWFISRHLGITLDCAAMDALDLVYRRLIDAALAQPRVLVHRDFMPRNLMPAADGPAVLDFQDAVLGPIAYDALSLFKDAFLSWPEARVDAWLDTYHARAQSAGLPVPALAQFRRDADWIGVQRHLKVIGIFARLCHRDGKPKYLQDVPRFFAYLDGVLPKYPELAPLQDLIEHTLKPAIAAAAGSR
jgi:aminoglycoside/choline kinase family phosphotransferase